MAFKNAVCDFINKVFLGGITVKNRMLKKVLCNTLTLVLSCGIWLGAVSPVAAGSGTEAAPAKATITKELQMAAGVKTPNADFKFVFTKVKQSSGTTSAMPTIGPVTASFTEADNGTVVQGVKTVIAQTNNILENVSWPHAGTYEYSVKEDETTSYAASTDEAVVYSKAEYKMYVRVANGTNGLYVDDVGVAEVTDDKGNTSSSVGKVDPAPAGPSGNGFRFVNEYSTMTGNSTNAALTITNNVVGTYADLSKEFQYTLRIKSPAIRSILSVYKAEIIKANGTQTTVDVSPNQDATFMLAHGESVRLISVPAGATYTIQQDAVAGYRPSYSVVENGGTPSQSTAANFGDALSATDKLIGSHANSIAFTNTFDDQTISPTGILIDNMPFVILIVAAILAFAGILISRKFRMER